MLIERLTLQNFIRFRRKCEIDFRGKGTVGIVGPNEVGKSSILQAICYAYYGRTRADREEQLISDNAKGDMLIGISLRLEDGSLFEIRRGRTLANNPILTCTGYTSSKVAEVQDVISSKLGIGYEDFITLSYFLQGDIHQFMTGNKREYFNRWTSTLAVWSSWEAEAKQKERQATAKLDAIRLNQHSAELILEESSSIKAEARAAKANLQELESMARILAESASKLETQVAKQTKGEDYKTEVARLKGSASDVRIALDGIEDSINTSNNELAGVSSGKCPLVGIKCEDLKKKGGKKAKQIRSKLAALAVRKSKLEDRIATINTKLKAVTKKRATANPIEVESTKLQLRETRSEVAHLQVSIKASTIRLGRAEAKLDALKQASDKVKATKVEAAKYEAELRRWQFISFMCGKSGVPAKLIEEQLALVEDQCNWVFNRLDYPKQIRFRGYRDLKGLDAVCKICGSDSWKRGFCGKCGSERQHKRKDEPTVTILDGAIERPFCLESGGAQVLESFAARLAVSLFRSNMLNVPLRTIMLDEIFAHLDAENQLKLLDLVIGKLQTQFGLKQILVVSHLETVSNSVSDTLRVSTEKGSAVAKWV